MDAHAAYAKAILRRHLLQRYKQSYDVGISYDLPEKTIHSTPDTRSRRAKVSPPPKDTPICIIGAGVAGLAVAIHLQEIGYTNIDILEASDRHGGRCYTYPFKSGPASEHNYYDVGAMRIPDVPTMKSTFSMINYLNDPAQGQNVVLKDYVYSLGYEPTMYFYSSQPQENAQFDSFMTNPQTGILVVNNFVTKDLQPGPDFDKAFWDYIRSADTPDKYSTRAFLTLKNSWTYEQAQRAEMLDTSTGLFDQAWMETICDYYDFFVAKTWHRVDGGMSKLTDAMYNVAVQRKAKITCNTPVVAMKDNGSTIGVTTSVGTTTQYGAVFNTTALAALQRMDLSGLSLSDDALIGIRALSYDRATKVAIKFSNPWWIPLMRSIPKGADYKYGGVSSSDLPISNVVYPSWDDGPTEAHTIIVSYSWAQDATRIASLIDQQDVERTDGIADPLIQLIFSNLVKLWSSVPAAKDLAAILQKTYIAHHAFAWSQDPLASGGFALFGPGQFENLYTNFTQPLRGNKLMVCGEAISAHHAWISGALDSAYDAVMAWSQGNNDIHAKVKLKDSMLGGGPGEHPAELDETLLFWHVELAEEGVLRG